MEDLKVIQAIQNGEMGLFSKLYDSYIDKIYKYVYLKTFDMATAEDITSDVFYSALNSIMKFDTESSWTFQSWLYTIASNKVKDFYKSNKHDVSLEDFLEESYSEDFAKKVDDKQKIDDVLTFLSGMKEDQKEIVLLRIWHDLSYQEISEMTGKTLDNCKKIVSRTLKNISANLVLLLVLIILL